MKIAIVGAGAIGGFLGTRLGIRGHAMHVVARGATLRALQAYGLRLRERDHEHVVPVTASEDASSLGPQDLVIIAVKEPALIGAVASVPPLLGPDTVVLTAMNGVPWWFFLGMPGPLAGTTLASLDPDGVIAATIPAKRVVGSVVYAACTTPEPGVAQHVMGNGLIIGEPEGGVSGRVAALVATFNDAGLECRSSARIQQDVWFKLWGNMTTNPLSALTGATADRILDDELVRDFCLATMAEAAAIGAVIGCPIGQSGEERMEITRKLGAIRTSMLQDVDAGRPLEIDALLAVVREIARRCEVATPALDALLGVTRLFARTRGLYPA
ncbi:MAG: 2-dehydropantoate 2-reductase [Betaproteobacteria bacterium]